MQMIEKIDTGNVERSVNHWIESSDRDFNTMQNLYKSKDYSWSLFIGSFSYREIAQIKVYPKQTRVSYSNS